MKKLLLKLIPTKKKKQTVRAPRIRFTKDDEVFFEASQFHGHPITVINLSLSGVGLDRSALNEWPEIDAELEGRFFIQKAEIPVQLKIKNISPNIIGGVFVGDASPLKKAIYDYFSTELEAKSMSLVKVSNPELIPKEGNPFWYHSPEGLELYFVEHKDNILKFHMSWNKHFLDYSEKNQLRYGELAELETEKIIHKRSQLIQWKKNVEPQYLRKLVRILKNIENLNPDHLQKILVHLKV